jgi:hypothetical protein
LQASKQEKRKKKKKKERKKEGCPSNQVSAAAVIPATDEKWRPFNCFFIRVGLRTYQKTS